MTTDPQDIIDAHLHQLMGMAKAHAETAALLEAAKREIAELKQLINKKATDGTDRDTVYAGNDSKQQGQQDSDY